MVAVRIWTSGPFRVRGNDDVQIGPGLSGRSHGGDGGALGGLRPRALIGCDHEHLSVMWCRESPRGALLPVVWAGVLWEFR